jgi:hypothetical protein
VLASVPVPVARGNGGGAFSPNVDKLAAASTADPCASGPPARVVGQVPCLSERRGGRDPGASQSRQGDSTVRTLPGNLRGELGSVPQEWGDELLSHGWVRGLQVWDSKKSM